MKKIVHILLSIIVIFSNSSIVVFAQQASDSSQSTFINSTGTTLTVNSNTGLSTSTAPFEDKYFDSTVTPTDSFRGPNTSSILPTFNTNSSQAMLVQKSTQNKQWVINKSSKKDFKGDEDYSVNINNINSADLSVNLYDPLGDKVDVKYQMFQTPNGTTLEIVPPKKFRPGKYTLKITDVNGQTQTQDFTWGVIAINTNKSIYLSGETAKIAMAVLDDTGNMVCDANVKLEIKNPNSETTILSTQDGSIVINQQCRLHNFSLTPDYQASYQTSVSGNYDITLTATTSKGVKSVSDSFQVKQSVPFDVERETATRIYPPSIYPVNLNIKVNQDFKGQIVEYIPSSFDIFPSSNSAAPNFEVKQIATLVKNGIGTVSPLHLAFPFSGTKTETLGFSEHLLDPKERDYYAQYGLSGHDGLDFAMPIGTSVYSGDDGTVVMAGGVIYGTTVVIQHSWGRSYYGHLSKVKVKVGQTVSKGEEIALSGQSGIVTGPHLHFGIKLNQNDPANGFYGKVDPSPYLGLTQLPQVSAFDNTTKAIVWNVDVKKGDNLLLSYNFKTPPKSPQFYTLGPLSFVQGDNVMFQEARVWQLAVDAANVIILTTGTSWSVPANFNPSNNTIEAIGGGGGGAGGSAGGGGVNTGSIGAGGGGGGEYRKISNFNPGAGPISYSIGSGGTLGSGGIANGGLGTDGTAGTATTWNSTSLVANGGSQGLAAGTGGAGGTGGTGTAANFNGGTGGAGGAGSGNSGGGGGGGAGAAGTAAVGGTGSAGVAGGNGGAGGAGGATSGGAGGSANSGTGGNGTVWTDTSSLLTGGAGGGGGGGTGGASAGGSGGLPGNYGSGGGGGGGGARRANGGAGANGANGVIVITYSTVANTTEFGYRWRSDDGNETTGSSLATENTDITGLVKNTNIRLRFLLYNSGGSNASAQTFRLDYAPLSGTCSTSSFAAVPTGAGSEFITHSTANYTDGTSSTNVSSGPAVITDPSGGTFTTGNLLSTSNTTASITLNSIAFTEIEYNFQATTLATDLGVYCFRVSNAGTAIDTYSKYAQVTILSSGPTLSQLMRHGKWFNNGVEQPFTF